MRRILNWFRTSAKAPPIRRSERARLELEQLEERQLLAVNYHQGPLISHVNVEPVYYGDAWYAPGMQQPQQQLNNYFMSITDSPYMDMLAEYSKGGYTIGRGTSTGPHEVPGQFAPGQYPVFGQPTVDDSQIRTMLQGQIQSLPFGHLFDPANHLYVVFTPPNVCVTAFGGALPQNSVNNFLGYHDSFQDTAGEAVYYAVVPHPYGNADINGLSAFQQMTEVSSHELAEAVTDPVVWQDRSGGFHGTGWHQGPVNSDTLGSEIGDLATSLSGIMNGYTVQGEWSNRANAPVLPNTQGAWENLGPYVTQVTVGMNANGCQEAFGIGGDHALWHKWQNAPNGGWSAWYTLGGNVKQITMGTNRDGRIEVFAIGGDNMLHHIYQVGSNGMWSSWDAYSDLRGNLPIKQITVGTNLDGRMELFAVGGDNMLHHIYQVAPSRGWSAWDSGSDLRGNLAIKQIAVGRNFDGRMELFAVGGDNMLHHIYQVAPNSGWSAWDAYSDLRGGVLIQQVAVGSNADGRLQVFAIGLDNTVRTLAQVAPSSGWGSWSNLGGSVQSISVGRKFDGRLDVFAVGADNAVWVLEQTAPSDSWGDSSWFSLGGSVQSLAVGMNANGCQEIFALWSDGSLRDKLQNTPYGSWS